MGKKPDAEVIWLKTGDERCRNEDERREIVGGWELIVSGKIFGNPLSVVSCRSVVFDRWKIVSCRLSVSVIKLTPLLSDN
jgi:hypothetical protein